MRELFGIRFLQPLQLMDHVRATRFMARVAIDKHGVTLRTAYGCCAIVET